MADDGRIPYEKVQEQADTILSKLPDKPKVGIICGTAMSTIADQLEDKLDISYEDIPDFLQCSVPGHESMVSYGKCADVPIICFRGRFHLYEGFSVNQIVLPIKLMKLMGVKLVIITNGAVGINQGYAVGDIMLFKDHINFVGLSGSSPMDTTDDRWGSRFFRVTYDKHYRDKAKDAFNNCGFDGTLQEGVYVCLGGPNQETIAEINMLKLCGADAIGVSTVHETLAAMHCDMKVLAFSIIHNIPTTDYDTEASCTLEEVTAVCQKRAEILPSFLQNYLQSLQDELADPKPPVEPQESVTPEPQESVTPEPQESVTVESREGSAPQRKGKPCVCKRGIKDDTPAEAPPNETEAEEIQGEPSHGSAIQGAESGQMPTGPSQGSTPKVAESGHLSTGPSQGSTPKVAESGHLSTGPSQGSTPKVAESGQIPTGPSQGSTPKVAESGHLSTGPSQGSTPKVAESGQIQEDPSHQSAIQGAESGQMPTGPSQGSTPKVAESGHLSTGPSQGSTPKVAESGQIPTGPSQGSTPKVAESGQIPTGPSQGSTPKVAESGQIQEDPSHASAVQGAASGQMPTGPSQASTPKVAGSGQIEGAEGEQIMRESVSGVEPQPSDTKKLRKPCECKRKAAENPE